MKSQIKKIKMVKKTHDLPETAAGETLAHKLRSARDDISLSRAKVQSETGIPAKTIEKYEDGSLEPPLSRLKTLCKLYKISFHEFLEEEKSAESQVSGIPEKIEKYVPDDATFVVSSILDQLDEYRSLKFKGVTRKSAAMASDLLPIMNHLEVDELLKLGKKRGLFQGDYPAKATLIKLLEADFEEGQDFCHFLQGRIVDTAIFGVDLLAIDLRALAKLADELCNEFDIEKPSVFGWGQHGDLIPAIHWPLCQLAFTGEAINFSVKKRFPSRKLESTDPKNQKKSKNLFMFHL